MVPKIKKEYAIDSEPRPEDNSRLEHAFKFSYKKDPLTPQKIARLLTSIQELKDELPRLSSALTEYQSISSRMDKIGIDSSNVGMAARHFYKEALLSYIEKLHELCNRY